MGYAIANSALRAAPQPLAVMITPAQTRDVWCAAKWYDLEIASLE
jgi:hypothetical protein